ncbi:hypothetical protein C7974DRAFT_471326 [Boeremia exigua]|uniref:uncharacterized protein n=1 Tax=Boeremia exigua TaxID=749465 RepID=UPI001E8D26FA|nr:uncharacterized protein C7974DRAFT_471326 [Boeremia exigua]KAH6633095.1 hypothetical protein C7974DRAFT_471326 [Boeremia exigua]
MRSPSMPNLFSSSSFAKSSENLHPKSQAEFPRRSKTDTISGIVRAFGASEKLQQRLGLREPELYAAPPAMSSAQKVWYETGLYEYEMEHDEAAIDPWETVEDLTASQSKSNLADIPEEKESPEYAASIHFTGSGSSTQSELSVERTSTDQAADAAPRYTFLNSDSDGESCDDTADELADYDPNEDYSLWQDESSSTLAVSDSSRPSSAENSKETAVAPSFPPRVSSLSTHHNPNPTLYHSRTKQVPSHDPTKLSVTKTTQHINTTTFTSAARRSTSLRRAESLPVLSPSSDVQQDPRQHQHEHAPRHANVRSTQDPVPFDGSNKQRTPSHPPRITIQPPSPAKPPSPPHPPSTTGLPLCSAATSRTPFPGNTPHLLSTLLTWSLCTWTQHARSPGTVPRPVRHDLLSVGFYDTSTTPHTECRFLGPGDAEASYHEVDVWEPGGGGRGVRWAYVVMRARGGAGEAGDGDEGGETRPHAMVAWHADAVTGVSRCLHTLFASASTTPVSHIPASPPSLQPQPPHTETQMSTPQTQTQTQKQEQKHTKPLKRFASLQNLTAALRPHAQRPNTPAPLPDPPRPSTAHPATALEPDTRASATLHRTVLLLGRSGRVPLVEGWRVDVCALRGWMGACGRGGGKVMLWREREE